MAAENEKYDAVLLGILQNEGKVAPFLDVMLGFLYRRTDFFRIMQTETDKLGFPPGIAHKLLDNIFKKYETLAKTDAKRVEEMRKAREVSENERRDHQAEIQQQTVTAESTNSSSVGIRDSDTVPGSHPGEVSMEADGLEGPVSLGEGHPIPRSLPGEVSMEADASKGESATLSSSPQPASSGTQTSEPSSSEALDEEDKENPEDVRLRRELQANPLTYNGAEREAYFWSQSITETDVRVKVSKAVVKGKQVKVDIQKKYIKVCVQASDGSWMTLVDGDLSWEINVEESIWSLVPGDCVHINLEKKQERWWEHVFLDEPKINTQKIDCSRPMTDLDDEAQAKIEEMMFNQRQKQLGLPQSHEKKTQEMLRKAWDAEGSPFKGQPFDPSRFSVDPNGTVNFN